MKKSLFIAFVFLFSLGCKKFIAVNEDPNNPEDVQESLLLAPVEMGISQMLNGDRSVYVIQMYMQNAALAQDAPNTDTYRLSNAEMDGSWRNIYVTLLQNLNVLTKKAGENNKKNYVAISKILTAFTLGMATDMWGDIPFTEALNGIEKLHPVYDKQEDVYTAMQTLLDDGIEEINSNDPQLPGTDDFFYKGNMGAWKRLAYTMKARYFIHLSKAPGYSGITQAEKALTALAQGMEQNSDDFKMDYPGAAGQEGPWFLNFQPDYALVLASTFVDRLQDNNDPRLPAMVKPAFSSGLYRGRVIGTTIESPDNYSYPSEFCAGIGAANYLLTYSEALFIKAEATLLKTGFSDAQPFYQAAISAHMNKLGIAPAAQETYLASNGMLNAENALEQIMKEKSIVNFLNFETFNDWRRTGFPALTIVENAVTGSIPRRLLYPQSEQINNPQPQQSVTLTDKVWWDNN